MGLEFFLKKGRNIKKRLSLSLLRGHSGHLSWLRRSALHSQMIDERVERGAVDDGVPDTHAEVLARRTSLTVLTALFTPFQNTIFPPQMCSPAQFRQQSAELYAVIDEVLADSVPPVSAITSALYWCIIVHLQHAE